MNGDILGGSHLDKSKVAILIDGGHLRVLSRKAGFEYNPNYIEKVAHACVIEQDEKIMRILYYDCAPYAGEIKLPVSGEKKKFEKSDAWMSELAQKDLFAVRKGVLKFRGWSPKKIPVPNKAMTDFDFQPNFEQKGVDKRGRHENRSRCRLLRAESFSRSFNSVERRYRLCSGNEVGKKGRHTDCFDFLPPTTLSSRTNLAFRL